MGVDADYVYGYMIKKNNVEWDIEFLREKFNLDENLNGWLKEYTYADLVQWLVDDEVDDWYDVEDILGIKSEFVYDEEYLYFTHFHIISKFPDRRLEEFDQLVKEYAKDCGVKNYEDFKWKEFGFFS